MDVEIYCECGRLLTVTKYQYRSSGIGYFYAKVLPCYVCARLTLRPADAAALPAAQDHATDEPIAVTGGTADDYR